MRKKFFFHLVRFAVSQDHKIEIKEWKKRNKYLHVTMELKRRKKIKILVIPIVDGVLRTVHNCLDKLLKY